MYVYSDCFFPFVSSCPFPNARFSTIAAASLTRSKTAWWKILDFIRTQGLSENYFSGSKDCLRTIPQDPRIVWELFLSIQGLSELFHQNPRIVWEIFLSIQGLSEYLASVPKDCLRIMTQTHPFYAAWQLLMLIDHFLNCIWSQIHHLLWFHAWDYPRFEGWLIILKRSQPGVGYMGFPRWVLNLTGKRPYIGTRGILVVS